MEVSASSVSTLFVIIFLLTRLHICLPIQMSAPVPLVIFITLPSAFQASITPAPILKKDASVAACAYINGNQKAQSETERRKFVMSLRRLFQDQALEGDRQNMGSTYGSIISYCLGKPSDLDIEGTGYTNIPLGSPNALRVAEALVQFEKNLS